MSFLKKIAQNVAQNTTLVKINAQRRSTKMWATSIIFGKLPKENNHPLGENSSDLVTLLTWIFSLPPPGCCSI
jgi:hypothetical protein